MANWRIYLFALACVGIIALSVAVIYVSYSYIETILLEPVYMIVIKNFAMGIGLLGLLIGLLRIPKENIP